MVGALEALPRVSPFLRAIAYAGLSNREEMFALLETAVRERDNYVPDLGVSPIFNAYRTAPRFQALLRKMRLH